MKKIYNIKFLSWEHQIRNSVLCIGLFVDSLATVEWY